MYARPVAMGDPVRSIAAGGARVVLALVIGLILLGLGYTAGSRPSYALAAAGAILVLGVLLSDLVLLPIAAFPFMLVLTRVGGGNGLSVSDGVLFLATVCALLQLRTRESPELRSLLWLVVVYQAALLPTLIRNPYTANGLEWAHELVLVGGSLVVGWVVGWRGRAKIALGWYVGVSAVLGVAAAVQAPLHHFEPVYLKVPAGMSFQKNALGDLLAFAMIVAYIRPVWLGWRPRWANTAIACCLAGILATQSKQAMISVAVGVAVMVIRAKILRRRARMIVLATIPLLVIAYVVTMNQLASTNKFNAANQRLTWYGDSLHIWQMDRWFGVGLRWWYTDRFHVNFQPPNAELEMLTSAGVLGLAAFLITSLVALRILWGLDPRFGTIAFAVLAARLVQGQLDLFWVASQSSVPWLIVGAALGALSLARHEEAQAGRALSSTAGPAPPAR